MLNIGRMGRGSQRYYLDHVARGVQDYYLGRGEAPGHWVGHGARGLALGGQVSAEQLGAVLAGEHPETGERLAAHPARKVPGFDLTFRAPKSVSLLWALADADTAMQVRAAHDAAVAATVGYLQRHVARSRRGAGGAKQVAVDGLVGAAFRHRTSRAGDPLLHTHLLVANLARTTDDGVWRTLDSRRLFTHAKTAGTLYQAHLRSELTRTLGVAWQPVMQGCADLADVPRPWIDAFSKRRTAIVHELQRRGESSAAAAQVATLDTRQAKVHQPDEPTLRQRWRTEADEHGIDPGWWRGLLHRHQPTVPDLSALYRQLVVGQGLTADTSTFAARDLVRTLAEQIPDGATVEEMEHPAGRLLQAGREHGEIVALGPRAGGLVEVIRRTDGRLVDASGGDGRFTTRRLLLLEQTTITAAVGRQDDGVAVVDPQMLEDVLGARPTLGDDQATMVRRLTSEGAGVAVVVGRAGTGKTYALDAARDAWTRAGIRVTGVALAARAALELQDTAGIPSTTLARLLHQLDDPTTVGSPLQPGQVLVVDEAGMIGTRPLARLLHHTHQARVKVVLVGDPRQLPEIDAGGLFAGLVRRLDPIELTGNRRQTHTWEQATLDQLRHGSLHTAIDTYTRQGRLVTADTAEELRERLVADWWHTHQQHPGQSSVMVALHKADVADLNARARTRLAAAGRLTGPTLKVDGTRFQAGDRIVCLRNRHRDGLVNGLQATITAVRDDHSLEVADDHGTELTIPADYLEAGHLTHGYAITGHKAQGLTVDHTYVLGSDALYREWGYVAMSRGRQSNRLYVHAIGDIEPDAHHTPPTVDPAAATVTRLSRSRAQHPASDHVAARWRQLTRWLDTDDVHQQPKIAAALRNTMAKREAVTAHIDELHRAQAGWIGPALTRRTRQQRDHTTRQLQRQAQRLQQLDRQIAELTRRHQAMPTVDQITAATREHEQLDALLRDRARDRTVQTLTRPPGYLLDTLGPPPDDRHGRARWQHAAHLIERYRVDWDITHTRLALGMGPTTLRQVRAHQHVTAELDRLTRPRERQQVRQRTRALSR